MRSDHQLTAMLVCALWSWNSTKMMTLSCKTKYRIRAVICTITNLVLKYLCVVLVRWNMTRTWAFLVVPPSLTAEMTIVGSASATFSSICVDLRGGGGRRCVSIIHTHHHATVTAESSIWTKCLSVKTCGWAVWNQLLSSWHHTTVSSVDSFCIFLWDSVAVRTTEVSSGTFSISVSEEETDAWHF